jgi:hypothetical protein
LFKYAIYKERNMTVALPPVSLTTHVALIRGMTKQLNDYMVYGGSQPETNGIDAEIIRRKSDIEKSEPVELLKAACKFILSQIATLPLYIGSAVAIAAVVTFLPLTLAPLFKLAALIAVCRISAIVWNGTFDSAVSDWLDEWSSLMPSENKQLKDAAKEFKNAKDKLEKLEEYRRKLANPTTGENRPAGNEA